MTLEQIMALAPEERVNELKKRKTDAPNVAQLMSAWDEKKHRVNDESFRPKREVVIEEEVRDDSGKLIKPEKKDKKDVNRIAIPLEQDIVNIHVAFTVGQEPKIAMVDADPDQNSQNVFSILKDILRKNKIKFQNKKIVRAWLAEQEVAEYWYTVNDASWWKRIVNRILKSVGSGELPTRKLKSVIWSPFRGDKLYPYFDDYGDLIVLSREYDVTEVDGTNKVTKLMSIDSKNVTIYVNGKIESTFEHKFKKLPALYAYRPRAYCDKIITIRERLETLLSNYADCLDYNFFPKMAASGVVEDIVNRNGAGDIIQLENGGQVAYLTWQQSPEMAKLEFDNLTERAYAMTNTPRISFENLKGAGSALSGVAFKYAFMGAHMAVSNHAEEMEEFFQRRANFLLSAIGSIYSKYENIAEEVEVETEIVPFMIDNRSTNIADAVSAVEGGVASLKQGIILAGLTDQLKEEMDAIEAEKQKTTE